MGDDLLTSAPAAAVVRRWRRRLADEREEARVYRDLARRRAGEEREILLGLLSGALSMGAGEYISVRSQRELLAASTPDAATARAAVAALDVDANELALVYRARGMEAAEAQRRADAVLRRQPVGPGPANPGTEGSDVVGSGIGAALSSFAFFAGGAAVPVLPFLLGLASGPALLVAALLVGAALLLTGATVGVLSGASPLRRALRQLAVGAGASAVTYLLGVLFGAVTS